VQACHFLLVPIVYVNNNSAGVKPASPPNRSLMVDEERMRQLGRFLCCCQWF